MNQKYENGQMLELPFKVNKEVISHLSLGLYRNFARAIKELISNAYDAGATETKIKLDLDKSEIIIRDNGRGMSLEDIKSKFLTIGYITSPPRGVDELGRQHIGTFGIGCLSVFPYCDTVQVITKKQDADEFIELTIDTHKFFGGVPSNIEEEKAQGRIHKSDLPKEVGETIIILKGIKPHLVKELRKKKKGSWSSIDRFSGFEKFKWMLSQYAPIEFQANQKELRKFFREENKVPMRLWLDGEEIFRNVTADMEILDKGEEKFGKVRVKYLLMTSKKPVQPEEARGLQVRLRNVAVGLPTDFEVTKLTGKVPGKINYLSGEVYIIEGLDSALMIDRDSFSYTQEVSEMQEFFRRKLIKYSDVQERWARQDKTIYEALMPLENPEPIIEELKKAKVIHFAKERLRIPKESFVKKGKRKLVTSADKIRGAISEKTDFKVVSKKGGSKNKRMPVEVKPREKEVVIYEDHPQFSETIQIENRDFIVTYEQWDYRGTPYSICKLDKTQKKVIFNSSHPLFNSKISEAVIKKLSLGFIIILKDNKGGKGLLIKLNKLLEEVFSA